MSELSSLLTAAPGGVMTDEVGVITGELELRTTRDRDGTLAVEVRYAGGAGLVSGERDRRPVRARAS